MTGDSLKVPVLAIGFNRPDLLAGLLSQIPLDGRDVYISIDGPRSIAEELLVNETIEVANRFKNTSQGVHVQTKYYEKNLGCKYGVYNAIDWAFSLEDKLIILEDDVRPISQFFEYCDRGLSFFENHEDIWQLNGWTPLDNENLTVSIYKTIHSHIWGWATWKNRWDSFDLEMSAWKEQKLSKLPIFKDSDVHPRFDAYWKKTLNDCATGKINTWDSQWLFSMWMNNGFALSPSKRLCGNVGFDERATHTPTSGGEIFSRLPNGQVIFEPAAFYTYDSSLRFDRIHDVVNYKLDEYIEATLLYSLYKLMRRISKNYLRNVIRKIKRLKVN